MKRLLFILALFITVSSQAQLIKYRSTNVAITKELNEKIHNPPWTPTDVLITLDFTKSKIHIYNKKNMSFDIINTEDERDDGSVFVWKYYVMDKDGDRCYVSFMKDPKDTPMWSIIVDYSDAQLIYTMNVIRD